MRRILRYLWSRAWDRVPMAPIFLVNGSPRARRFADRWDDLVIRAGQRFPRSWFDQDD